MKIILAIAILIQVSCNHTTIEETRIVSAKDTIQIPAKEIAYISEGEKIQTGNTTPQQLIDYAQTLIGVPYKYGSTDPSQGFDCSGFITCVFNHFNIAVPRTSIGFTNVEREIGLEDAKPGDIILFTGTDSTNRDVGHMGIITLANDENHEFIHSSSGKANGVTITPLNKYYMGRFVKVIRVFEENNMK